jgi:hypothetical protein
VLKLFPMGPISEGHLTAPVFESENEQGSHCQKLLAYACFTKIENFSSISSA